MAGRSRNRGKGYREEGKAYRSGDGGQKKR